MSIAQAPALAPVVETQSSGNLSYQFVRGLPLTEDYEERAVAAAADLAVLLGCARHVETYAGDDCWIVVWEIH